jgi:uncharacterized phage protein (TIGR01671 family)
MREIKFRAWDKRKKRMYDTVVLDGYSRNRTMKVGWVGYFPIQKSVSKKEAGNFILMQYTGLTDKNGKEIYEGDIVKCGNNLYLVKWVEGGFVALNEYDTVPSHMFAVCEWEVVGNVFENPELSEVMGVK